MYDRLAFINPDQLDKISMLSKKDVGKLLNDIDKDQLLTDYGGNLKLPDKIWPAKPTLNDDNIGQLPINFNETDDDKYLYTPELNKPSGLKRKQFKLGKKSNEETMEEKIPESPSNSNEVQSNEVIYESENPQEFNDLKEDQDHKKLLVKNSQQDSLQFETKKEEKDDEAREDKEDDIFSDRKGIKLRLNTGIDDSEKNDEETVKSKHEHMVIADTIEDEVMRRSNSLKYSLSKRKQSSKSTCCCCILI